MNLRFLIKSAMHHELTLLMAVHRSNGLRLPVNPAELPAGVMEQVPLARLLDNGTLAKVTDGEGARIMLTATGTQHLRQLVIDFHLELMDLRSTSDSFIAQRVRMLERAGCRRVLLYGASDTARALLEFLRGSAIEVLAVLDDDVRKHGLDIGGVSVVPADRSGDYDCDTIVVSTIAFQDKILQKCKATVRPGTRVIGLFDDYQNQGAPQ